MSEPSRNQPCPCGSGLKYKRCCGLTTSVPGSDQGPGASGKYAKTVIERNVEYLHIVMPTRGAVSIETMMAIASFGWNATDYSRLGVNRATFLFMPRMNVADARERLAEAVQKGMDIQPAAKHWVLWLDDDAAPTLTDIMCLLNEIRRNPDIGIMSCYYCPKEKNHPGWVPRFGQNENVLLTPGIDFQADHIIEVPWVGLHCAVMRGELIAKLERPMFPSDPMTGCGEDVGFSHRIRDAGYVCAVHAGVPVKHIDVETGEAFLPCIGGQRIKQDADAEAVSL